MGEPLGAARPPGPEELSWPAGGLSFGLSVSFSSNKCSLNLGWTGVHTPPPTKTSHLFLSLNLLPYRVSD